MNSFKELINHARVVIRNHPDLREEIINLIDLYQSEVEEGGSVQHELNLCATSIDELVEEKTKEKA
jgi:hypothetical protein